MLPPAAVRLRLHGRHPDQVEPDTDIPLIGGDAVDGGFLAYDLVDIDAACAAGILRSRASSTMRRPIARTRRGSCVRASGATGSGPRRMWR